MSKASCRGISEALKFARQQGYALEPIVEGLGVPEQELLDPGTWIEWDTFVALTNNLEEAVGGPDEFEAFVRSMVGSPRTKGLQRMLGIAVSPRQMYKMMFGWLGPSMYPAQTTSVDMLPGSRVRIVVQIPPEDTGCESFLRSAKATVEATPKLLGKDFARVQAQITSHRGEFVVDVPPSDGFLNRMRRLMTTFSDAQGTIDELVRQQRELGEQYTALQETNRKLREHERELEEQIARREEAEAEIERLDEQLRHAQKMDALGRFAGGIAHDFNNLLTVMLALGEELQSSASSPELVSESASEIVTTAERAAKLTERLLHFSARHVIEMGPMDLNELVGEYDGVLQRLVGGAVQIRIVPSSSPEVVSVDAECLGQILVNLVANARDAMRQGGIVTITVSPSSDGGGSRIRVEDSGVGMSETVRQRIFEPFFTTKGPHAGTGLGMSMVYSLATRMDGAVRVESTPGVGTSVEVEFPRAVMEQREPVAEVSHVSIESQGESVLVVDDQPSVREVLVRALTKAGYRVSQAESASQAFNVIESTAEPIQLLVADVMLADSRGTEVAEFIADRGEASRVLFVSGYTGDVVEDSDRNAIESANFLHKPFGVKDFLHAVRTTLDAPG